MKTVTRQCQTCGHAFSVIQPMFWGSATFSQSWPNQRECPVDCPKCVRKRKLHLSEYVKQPKIPEQKFPMLNENILMEMA